MSMSVSSASSYLEQLYQAESKLLDKIMHEAPPEKPYHIPVWLREHIHRKRMQTVNDSTALPLKPFGEKCNVMINTTASDRVNFSSCLNNPASFVTSNTFYFPMDQSHAMFTASCGIFDDLYASTLAQPDPLTVVKSLKKPKWVCEKLQRIKHLRGNAVMMNVTHMVTDESVPSIMSDLSDSVCLVNNSFTEAELKSNVSKTKQKNMESSGAKMPCKNAQYKTSASLNKKEQICSASGVYESGSTSSQAVSTAAKSEVYNTCSFEISSSNIMDCISKDVPCDSSMKHSKANVIAICHEDEQQASSVRTLRKRKQESTSSPSDCFHSKNSAARKRRRIVTKQLNLLYCSCKHGFVRNECFACTAVHIARKKINAAKKVNVNKLRAVSLSGHQKSITAKLKEREKHEGWVKNQLKNKEMSKIQEDNKIKNKETGLTSKQPPVIQSDHQQKNFTRKPYKTVTDVGEKRRGLKRNSSKSPCPCSGKKICLSPSTATVSHERRDGRNTSSSSDTQKRLQSRSTKDLSSYMLRHKSASSNRQKRFASAADSTLTSKSIKSCFDSSFRKKRKTCPTGTEKACKMTQGKTSSSKTHKVCVTSEKNKGKLKSPLKNKTRSKTSSRDKSSSKNKFMGKRNTLASGTKKTLPCKKLKDKQAAKRSNKQSLVKKKSQNTLHKGKDGKLLKDGILQKSSGQSKNVMQKSVSSKINIDQSLASIVEHHQQIALSEQNGGVFASTKDMFAHLCQLEKRAKDFDMRALTKEIPDKQEAVSSRVAKSVTLYSKSLSTQHTHIGGIWNAIFTKS